MLSVHLLTIFIYLAYLSPYDSSTCNATLFHFAGGQLLNACSRICKIIIPVHYLRKSFFCAHPRSPCICSVTNLNGIHRCPPFVHPFPFSAKAPLFTTLTKFLDFRRPSSSFLQLSLMPTFFRLDLYHNFPPSHLAEFLSTFFYRWTVSFHIFYFITHSDLPV